MVSTFTTNRHLEQPAHGDYVNDWEIPVNGNESVTDAAFGGVTLINVTAASGTIVLSNSTGSPPSYICPIIKLSGALTADVNYQFPSTIGGTYVIVNATTGAHNVVFSSGGAGTTVTIPQGLTAFIFVDGTNVSYVASVPSLGVTGALTVGGHTTFEGVTSTGATGTGKLAYSISPTFTGTLNAAAITATGLVAANSLTSSTTAVATGNITSTTGNMSGPGYTLVADGGSGSELVLTGFGQTAIYNWAGITGTANFQIVAGGSGGVILNNGDTSWSAVSDERLKTDLVPITNALGALAQWRTRVGRLKTDPVGKQRQFLIAQDVQKTTPGAVWADEDGILHLGYTETIPTIVAAINELAALVAALGKRA